MKHRRTITAISMVLLITVSQAQAQQPDSLRPVNISIVFDGSWDRNQEIRTLLESEIRDLTRREFDVGFDPAHNVNAGWTLASVSGAIDQMLADPAVDLLITMGVVGSQYVAGLDTFPKPVIAPIVVDAAFQGFPMEGGASGVPNLSYLSFPNTITRDLKKFREITDFDQVMLLTNENVVIPNLGQRIAEASQEVGIQILGAGVGRTAESALASLPNDVEAVYVAPLFHMPATEFDKLVDGLIERRLPTFAFFGEPEVERGVMASLNPDLFPRLVRRVALHVLDILLGADPGTLPVLFRPDERLQINLETARAVGVYPEWGIMTEADVIHDLQPTGPAPRRLTLAQAMQEGIQANLSLLAEDRLVAAGRWQVRQARAPLLPQLDLSTTGVVVDKNLAETSFGSQPQRSLQGALTLTQILYSDAAFSNLSIQRTLQEARTFDRETLQLDVALDVAVAYLNVLRAKAFERIQLENVRLTRSNLELARVRETLGQSGPAEVLRWESQIATNRQNQILTSAERRAAEIALNQLLNRPLEEEYITAESELEDPAILIDLNVDRYLPYVNNPQFFDIFRDFMTREALVSAPELLAFDKAIEAQETAHRITRRAFWSPTVALQGGLNSQLVKSGAGSEGGLMLPPEFGAAFPEANDTHWNVGVSLTFPIFQGGGKRADRGMASETLARLRTERELTRNLVEQRVRTAVELAGGSFGSIEQANQAADAAERTRELVTDAYARGAVSILDLLDAQNAALVTREVAANAVYDFLIDLMQLQRSTGAFDFFRTPDELADFIQRLDDYFRTAGFIVN